MAAKTESTAVNALIDMVATGKPASRASDDLEQLFTAAPSRPPAPRAPIRVPSGTQPNVPTVAPRVASAPRLPPPPPTPAMRVTSSPPVRAQSIPPLNTGSARALDTQEANLRVTARSQPAIRATHVVPAAPERPSNAPTGTFEYPTPLPNAQVTTLPVAMPTAAPFERSSNAALDSLIEYVGSDAVAPARDGTVQMARKAPWKHFARALAVPMLVLFVAGTGIGGYLAITQRRDQARAAAAAVAAKAAAPSTSAIEQAAPPPPAPAPTMPPAAAPVLVEVRIDSMPQGAQVSLRDGAVTTFLGSTPLDATVDAGRTYEVLYTAPDGTTRTLALDASKARRLTAELAAVAAPAPAAAPVAKAPRAKRAVASAPVVVEDEADEAGEGILMISAKPPCEIAIDGKPTGLTTPQRSIPLRAGAHKVTLTNASAGIKKTITVKITADAPTKVIQDLMER